MLSSLVTVIKDARYIVAALLAVPASAVVALEYLEYGASLLTYFEVGIGLFAIVSVIFFFVIKNNVDKHDIAIDDLHTEIVDVAGSLSEHREGAIRASVETFADRFYSKARKVTNFTMTINSEKYLHGLREDCVRHNINSYTLSTIDEVLTTNSSNKGKKS